ncbi:MAG: radical SAM protein [Anaerolineae bacterium]
MIDIHDADVTGMTSCLVSGGCDQRGKVPVTTHLAQIQALRPGRLLNWHVGMIDEGDMRVIAPYVDIISFDFVGEDETIREVYGLDYTGDDYLRTYQMLRRYAKVVPHLTIGLRGGQIYGEYQALRQLKAVGLDALVLLVFMPTPETRYAHCQPPSLDEVVDFMLTARLTLPDTPIYLGCMRPGGRYRRELDALAVRAGVNKIVNPAPSAVQEAKDLLLAIQWESECCVIQRA